MKKVHSLAANSNCSTFIMKAFLGRNYFSFSGRACREEYWSIILVKLGVLFLTAPISERLSIIWLVYSALPTYSLMCRRYHDLNCRGWWMLLGFPNIGLPFFKGDQKDTRFGYNIYE